MSPQTVQELWDAVHAELGEDLRGVCRYEGIDSDFILRDDIAEQYSDTESQEIVDNAIVNQISTPNIVRSMNAGDLEATVHVLDEAWLLVHPDVLPGKSGILISADRNPSGDPLEQAGWCIDYLSRSFQAGSD